jgi:hypothetical protein
MLSAEFYGHATGTLVFGVRQGSVHAYKLNIIGCPGQSVLLFIVAKPYSWPKSVLTVVLQLKVFCRAQHTHAPVTPQAWAHFIQAHFRNGQAGGRATCFTMPSLPVVTAAVRRAI